jgi:hypothetical protein
MASTLTSTALDTQDLRARLSRLIRWTTTIAAVGALLAVASAVVLEAIDEHLSAEQVHFDHYRAQILWVEPAGSDSDNGTAHLTFVDAGRQRSADVHIDSTSSFSPGPATALVDPHDRGFVTLPGENYFPAGPGLALLLVGGFGMCALVAGAGAWKMRRKFRVLAHSTWKTVSGFTTITKNGGDKVCTVVFLPDESRDCFWAFSGTLPTPWFTGSVAIDRDRAVARVGDGRRLSFGTLESTGARWTTHRLVAANRDDTSVELRYFERDEERRCRVDCAPLDEHVIAALTGVPSVDLLVGPFRTAVVRVPGFGMLGIGVVLPAPKPGARARIRAARQRLR